MKFCSAYYSDVGKKETNQDSLLLQFISLVARYGSDFASFRDSQTQRPALFGQDTDLPHLPRHLFGRDKESAHGTQFVERYILPGNRYSREHPDNARMALEQHLLDTGGKGEVSFQSKRTVGEFRLSAFRLVAVRMERIREAETFGKGAQ